jgi:hypothetical protein
MARNRLEEAEYRRIADDLGLSDIDVRNAVKSYFDLIADDAKTAGLNTARKIYSKSVFETVALPRVRCIPSIGRMGPSYNRYLTWRANESKGLDMMLHPGKRNWLSPEEVEIIAKKVLSGEALPLREKNKTNFHRVWLVGEDGKKQARQVIKKD